MDSVEVKTAGPIVESDAAQVRALVKQHGFAEALSAGETLLATAPGHRDGLLLVAVAQCYL